MIEFFTPFAVIVATLHGFATIGIVAAIAITLIKDLAKNGKCRVYVQPKDDEKESNGNSQHAE